MPAPTVQKPLTMSTRTRPVLTSPDKTRDCCSTGSSFFSNSIVDEAILFFFLFSGVSVSIWKDRQPLYILLYHHLSKKKYSILSSLIKKKYSILSSLIKKKKIKNSILSSLIKKKKKILFYHQLTRERLFLAFDQ